MTNKEIEKYALEFAGIIETAIYFEKNPQSTLTNEVGGKEKFVEDCNKLCEKVIENCGDLSSFDISKFEKQILTNINSENEELGKKLVADSTKKLREEQKKLVLQELVEKTEERKKMSEVFQWYDGEKDKKTIREIEDERE